LSTMSDGAALTTQVIRSCMEELESTIVNS
jgi:hypothetical protein